MNEEKTNISNIPDTIDIIKVPVKSIVEFILRNGDIDAGNSESNIFDLAVNSAAVLGAKAHRKIQKSKFEGYKSEVSLNCEFEFKDFGFNINLGGRADGIFPDGDIFCVDEIKTSLTPFEYIDGGNIIHWGQAMCYAYMHTLDVSQEAPLAKGGKRRSRRGDSKTAPPRRINAQITYFQLETEEIKTYKKTFEFDELETFVKDLVCKYALWLKMERDWKITRNDSIDKLAFPFGKYRPGQRELAASVYRAIIAEKNLFANAPTGIGKTISTVFPAIKSMAHSNSDKIFYLTAKTVTRQAAYDAIYKMQKTGLMFKTVTVTAKDKICFLCSRGEERRCAPEYCEYAKGHYDRVNDAMEETLKDENNNAITREVIEVYAEKHKVCPFELSLDLSLYSDAVICDYNYAFDPVVYLKRFFQFNHNKNYIFLIDEAHNLIDRAREIYSAELKKSKFSSLKKSKVIDKKYKILRKSVSNINKYMLDCKKRCLALDNNGDNFSKYIVLKEHEKDEEFKKFLDLLRQFRTQTEIFFKENKDIAAASPPELREQYLELLQTYFDVVLYQVILNLYDDKYITYISAEDFDLKIKLFCLDPSYLIGEALKRAKSSVMFSATLSPLEYYREIYGGDIREDKIFNIASPFNRDNLCLIVGSDIKTRYKDRESSYEKIANYINILAETHGGNNYMAFFPSYEYMKKVYEIFCEKYPETPSIIQTSGMREEERDLFLDRFNCRGAHCASAGNKTKILVGFCVMGGIFSEGIDLTGDKLSGAVIVGVGLPKLSGERNIIKNYFNQKNGMGYEFAYMYPGMNKVLQAAGRVIRTETDRGVVLLLDERFNYADYRRLFPEHWNCAKIVRNTEQLKNILTKHKL